MSAVDVELEVLERELEALGFQDFEWAEAQQRVAARKVDLRDAQAVRAQIIEPFMQERAFAELLQTDPVAFDAVRAEAVAHVLHWWVMPTAAAHRLAQLGVAPLEWLPNLACCVAQRGPLRLISVWRDVWGQNRALDPNMVLRVAAEGDYDLLRDPAEMARALLGGVA